MGKIITKKGILLQLLPCGILLLLSALCILSCVHKTNLLDSQYEWKRWQGESEDEYAQISVFLPESASLGTEGINSFRSDMMKAFTEASLDTTNIPFRDAWSSFGSIGVTSDKANSAVPVIAVGGHFFDFHPLRLLHGTYISEDDADRSRIVLDEQLAWFLFGSSDVAGMQIKVGEGTFTVAGTVAHESDKASKKAYPYEMCLYMNYDAYRSITSFTENSEGNTPAAPVTCYEVVMPNPVKNFAVNIVSEKFPVKQREVVVNSERYSVGNLFAIAKDFAARAMSAGVAFPYWENAARYNDNKMATLSVISAILLISPFLTAAVIIIRTLVHNHNLLHDVYLPEMKEKTEEAVRSSQRRRWLRRHNASEEE